MTKGIELLVMGLGGLSLFVVAFLGFAAMSGSPLSEVAVIGPLLADDEEEGVAEDLSEVPEDELPRASEKQVIEANVGILNAYTLDSPMNADELQSLAVELKKTKLSYEERLRMLDERELSISEREDDLTHQFEVLEELRAELDRLESDLALRLQEVESEEEKVSTGEQARFKEIAKLFAEGEPKKLKDRFLMYEAPEAAQILRQLPPDRATELLNALPADKWKAYVEAYSALVE